MGRIPAWLALAASAVLVCGGLAAQAPLRAVPDGAGALGRCVATGPLDSVEDLNDFVGSAVGDPAFLGGDVGVDLRLGEGRSIWLFGDTLRRSAEGPDFVRNSMLLVADGCAEVVMPPAGGAMVPDRADGVGYWPMSAWRLQLGGGTVVHAMYQRVRSLSHDEVGGLGFVNLGPALTTFRMAGSGAPQLLTTTDLGADDPSPESPTWGAAAALDGGWLYLYGTSTRDLEGVHGFALRVARVRPERVGDQSSWRYWDGRGWRSDPSLAMALISEYGGVSQTLSVWPQDGRWYVLSKQDEFLGSEVVVWPGDAPVGPFGPPQPVAELPCDPATGELRYMPLAHPQLLPEPGTVVVSYSRNFLDVGLVCAAPERYRPFFIRVVLPD
ncbi:MAG TPA: DUF4185 domain-containing protein [Nocardioides sp.]|uniref:DUF4185 domain-containing protein n=1 Tax=Nocardioides sp. TaxID=35761 RepID=UPI002E31B99E|nr:DUF4185 domain-containing protein [Nocardioides sp.]HEX5086395.1 DUF4185 domain-containing protein [Nocardioides sp.]